MTNIELARRTIAAVRSLGVSVFCVCAGSRNAPLLAVLAATSGIRIYRFVDERSAAFFALGVGKRDGAPACVVTTSGTAVAELLPAAIEAHYSGTPLVLLTADRPSRFRGTGAPQSIDQTAIFGVHATSRIDDWMGSGALHVNVEFDEPLIDDEIEADAPWPMRMRARVTRDAEPVSLTFANPLVLIGGLAADDRELVREFALRLRAPVYAEPLSGLREDEALRELLVLNERSLSRLRFDGVIRIGNVPTLRFWRDVERLELPVVHLSRLPFRGWAATGEPPSATLEQAVATVEPAVGTFEPAVATLEPSVATLEPTLARLEPAVATLERPMATVEPTVAALEALPREPRRVDATDLSFDREQRARFEAILDDEPQSEQSLIRQLSRDLPHGSRIYLGNSLPIREWDLAATREQRGFVIEANRGANGIDGQLSTFFGWCKRDAENVAVVGDLTALYDLNAPWIAPQLEAKFRIVIINNQGGRIFERVATGAPALAINEHALDFAQWAAMFGIEVTELRPDNEATRRVWQRYDALWAEEA